MGSGVFTGLRVTVIGLMALLTTGCPGGGNGDDVGNLILPTDTLLNLKCADVGIFRETCVKLDGENPYANVIITEFDVNNPGAENKFQLSNQIPAGPTGAKARFYFWATALANRGSGENQWYTARALHELYTAQVASGFGDPIVQTQAIRAYRSVLDNFFGSVTFFQFPTTGGTANIPQQLNQWVGYDLVDTVHFTDANYPTGYEPLISTNPDLVRTEIGDWGYTYNLCSIDCPYDGLMFVNP